MLTCLTCAKQTDERGEGEVGGRDTPSTKGSVKSLTTQIKDMALKLSGAYKQCKPCSSPRGFKKEYRYHPDYDTASDSIPHPYIPPGSSTSTPAWDFATTTQYPSGRSNSRLTAGDRTPGGDESICTQYDHVLEEEGEPKEWMAQVEPGVHITFVSLPNGGNDLKRIRFSREMFNKGQAQRWWGENYDRIMELYNVQMFNRQALNTPSRCEDEQRDSAYTRVGSSTESPRVTPSFTKNWTPRHHYKPGGSRSHHHPSEPSESGGTQFYSAASRAYGGCRAETSSLDASRTTTSSRDDDGSVSISNASDLETEWVEQDEPGVYVTIRQSADGTRELRRVRFSREKFGEAHAKQWWEQNRERIQAQYL